MGEVSQICAEAVASDLTENKDTVLNYWTSIARGCIELTARENFALACGDFNHCLPGILSSCWSSSACWNTMVFNTASPINAYYNLTSFVRDCNWEIILRCLSKIQTFLNIFLSYGDRGVFFVIWPVNICKGEIMGKIGYQRKSYMMTSELFEDWQKSKYGMLACHSNCSIEIGLNLCQTLHAQSCKCSFQSHTALCGFLLPQIGTPLLFELCWGMVAAVQRSWQKSWNRKGKIML